MEHRCRRRSHTCSRVLHRMGDKTQAGSFGFPQPEAAPDDGTHKAEPPAEKAETENGRTREEQPPVELPAISEVIGAAQIPSIRQTLCETDKQENPQSDADDRES